MLARLTTMKDEREGGFTLIELLVVIIIIGILAAIAIPVFLNQRKKGYDAGIKADLHNAATAEETYLTDYLAYAGTQVRLATEGWRSSSAGDYDSALGPNLVFKLDGTVNGYCLSAKSASGITWLYDSEAGGLRAPNATCSF